jgi:hypothetical protein
VNPDDGVRHTTSELGASHFDRISAHHHISERDKIALLLVFNARHCAALRRCCKSRKKSLAYVTRKQVIFCV